MQTPSLFAPSNLMITTTLFGGMLYGLYPSHEALLLINQSGEDLKTQFANPLQAEYARVRIREDTLPSKILALAKQLTAQHFWQESNDLLGRLSKHPDQSIRQQADWLLLMNYLDTYYSTDNEANRLAHATAKQTVRSQLLALNQYRDWNAQQRSALARYCMGFELLPQAANHYAQLARTDHPQRQQWMLSAASAAGQAGLWLDAERYLRETRDETTAYAWMEAAIKAGKQPEAVRYLRTIQRNLPEDVASLTQLATISLKVGMPEMAVTLYQKLANTDPTNAQTWHEKTAHWAQAAGLYQVSANALANAERLTDRTEEQISLQRRTIGLWIQAQQPAKAAQALEPLLARPEYVETALEQGIRIAFLAEQQQRGKLASNLWRWILPHSNDQSLWEHVALWQGGRHRYASALSTWEHIEKHFGANTKITLMRIQLHWELHQYHQAFQLTKHQQNRLGQLASTYQRTILIRLTQKFDAYRQEIAMR